MNRAVIGLGSNLDPRRHIEQALQRIGAEHRVAALSTLVETEPIGVKEQPNFLNGAVLIETEMEREALTAWLHRLEADLGRVRATEKYGPRTIDLDLLVWNGEVVHVDVARRGFLRRAVEEVSPELVL